MTTSCGERLIQLLEAYGVDTVFGIPGVHTIDLYRGLSSSPIRHITPRHEQGAGFMADGYARATGKVGVCLIITGPGMTNMATPMGQAYADSIPMLVISAVNRRSTLGLGRGQLHELKNQRDMLSGVTTLSHTVLSAEELPDILAGAFGVLHAERPRPVHIEIPIDLFMQTVSDKSMYVAPLPSRPGPDPVVVARIVSLIVKASRLVLLVGGGCVDARNEVKEFVDLTGIPTCLTTNARGLLEPDHPLLLDGVQSSDAFREYLAQTDVCIAIGTELGETDYDFYCKGPLSFGADLVRIDIDPRQMSTNARPSISLTSDAALALRSLIDALFSSDETSQQRDGPTVVESINAALHAGFSEESAQYRELLQSILSALPDAIIVGDSTKPVYHANFTHRASAPRRWFNSVTGFGTLGYALPAAIGAKIGKPDAPVVAIVGDGGFQFTLNELMSARQAQVAVAIIVWNNSCYREIKDAMDTAGTMAIGVDITGPDLSKLSAAMGTGYTRAETIAEIGIALLSMKMRQHPLLIEYVPERDAR